MLPGGKDRRPDQSDQQHGHQPAGVKPATLVFCHIAILVGPEHAGEFAQSVPRPIWRLFDAPLSPGIMGGMKHNYFLIVEWILVISGVAFWLVMAGITWWLIANRLRGRQWLRFNLRTLFAIVTILGLSLGISWQFNRARLSQFVITNLEQQLSECRNTPG